MEADGLKDAEEKLAGKPVPDDLNEWCETPEQVQEREAGAESVKAPKAKPAIKSELEEVLAYLHPNTDAGKAAEKAEKLLVQAVDQASTDEGRAFLEKARELIKNDNLTIYIGGHNDE